MAELTAEIVRTIVKEEVGSLRDEMTEAIDRVLASVQSFHDEDVDEMQGIKGRLSNHNQRIAKLERLSKIR